MTKTEAKALVHLMTVTSLRKHTAKRLFKGDYTDADYAKLDKELEELAVFLSKRGKLEDQNAGKTDAGGESGAGEAAVSAVRDA